VRVEKRSVENLTPTNIPTSAGHANDLEFIKI